MNSTLSKAGYLRIGKVVGVHGIKGNVKLRSYAESLSLFEPNTPLFFENTDGSETFYTVEWVKPHTKTALMSLTEIENRDQAERLIGADIYIEKTRLPEPEAGAYYWFDLIGLSVYTNEGRFLGRVDSILPTGSNDVYVVTHPVSQKELLVPALASVVQSIDLDAKTMEVTLPDGL